MASRRNQINVRLTEAGEVRLYALIERMTLYTGIPLSMSDVVNAALAELERRYPPGIERAPLPPPAEPPPGPPLPVEPVPRGKPGRRKKGG